MIISHDVQLIFIHVHRTGGSSIINLLKNELRSKVEILSQHGNAKTAESSFLAQYPHYFTFGFVRNPWDRLLSWYSLLTKWDRRSLDQERLRFEQFIELNYACRPSDPFFHYNQLDYFTNTTIDVQVDRIGRYENYAQDAQRIFNSIGLPFSNIPQQNATYSKCYKDYYTTKSQKLVHQKCYKDIEHFGYFF
ncbi:sulfotransferase family protein [Aureispira anguillae]|uniref:Sulfotransferase family protein n=1 Tax=Aureispira anguillae TaxID=2864201 RepID=A0A915YBZ7_9BACT|nr:sulfotransferase family protein [Aureispira anguillae]BDS10280.1 sulfotransferase family protein [Aureispira anguillae]